MILGKTKTKTTFLTTKFTNVTKKSFWVKETVKAKKAKIFHHQEHQVHQARFCEGREAKNTC